MPDCAIRTAPVLALLFALAAFGQATSPPAGATQQNATQQNVARPGAAAQPGATGAAAGQPPEPAANSKVEITGRSSGRSTARRATGRSAVGDPTEDHPLLPIASLGNALGISSGTPIRIHLKADADSGHVKNGDMLNATLADPLAGMPAGTPVQLTVVQASKAGTILSYGELSVQVVSISQHPVLSDTITALGKEGPKEQPDAAPARGTEAIFPAD